MLHRKYNPFGEYKSSTQNYEYVDLYKKGDNMKSDNITVENEGIDEYGDTFCNFKIIHNFWMEYYIFQLKDDKYFCLNKLWVYDF